MKKMKYRGVLSRDEDKYGLKMKIGSLPDLENVPLDEMVEDFKIGDEIVLKFEEVRSQKRDMVTVKPISIGIHHYQDVYGSVCSADVKGCPPIPPPRREAIDMNIHMTLGSFAQYDFVNVDTPFVISDHHDLRRLPGDLSYDTDFILQKSIGCSPLEEFYIEQLGLPVYEKVPSEAVLRGFKVKKYLENSKFLYIGEIPSFSAPNGPWDFYEVQRRFGIRWRQIETNEFYRNFDRFSDDQVEKELENWKSDFGEIEPNDTEMLNATRSYLALRYLAEREDANGITVNCGRFTEERPVVPCLAFDRLIDEDVICSCEGDITALLSSMILHSVSDQPTLMGNFGSRKGRFEAEEGEVTIEHDIVPLSMGTGKFTVRDYHGREFGVTAYTDIQKQPMTLLNMNSEMSEISVFEGTIKYSVDGIHCRIIIHMDVDGDVSKVPEIVVGSQHMSMTFGHWKEELIEVARLLKLHVKTL